MHANFPLPSFTLTGVTLTFTFKLYLPVEIPVASSSGMHVIVQAVGSCTVSLIGICSLFTFAFKFAILVNNMPGVISEISSYISFVAN